MSEDLRPGDFVTSSVRLVRPIGQGGMGTVWLAEHLQLDTRVVVKVMAHGLEQRADILARFAREAMICAQVKSPHVVQVFDTGTTAPSDENPDGHPYIVMEHLEGQDLGKQLAEHGPMMPAAFVPIIVQLAKALARAHRAGIVHRDLKPENVFLCENEASNEPFVKLLDFGTAKVEVPSQKDMTSTDTGQVIGTPLYMSPEQILGEKEIDHRSDIWSLGVVAFEALTGKTPFAGATIAALALAIHDATPKLSDVVPEMPAALDAWFARACSRDKTARFQSVREAADAFVVAATGVPLAEPIESMAMAMAARPASAPVTERPVTMTPLIETLPKAGTEHRKVTLAAAAVIVTATALSALMIAGYSPAPEEPQGVVQTAPAAAPSPPAASPTPMPKTGPGPEAEPEPVAEMEPEPTAPAAEAPRPPKPNPPMLKGPKATYVPPAKPVRPVAAKGSPAPAPSSPPANPDEDLERLSNIPQPSPPPSEKLPPPEIPAE